jgi:hypothetical protein
MKYLRVVSVVVGIVCMQACKNPKDAIIEGIYSNPSRKGKITVSDGKLHFEIEGMPERNYRFRMGDEGEIDLIVPSSHYGHDISAITWIWKKPSIIGNYPNGETVKFE